MTYHDERRITVTLERDTSVRPELAPSRGPLEPPGDLIAFLLEEQRSLTAVEAFSRKHEAAAAPAQAVYYSRLLPASPPGPGQQYAFDVDLDRCSGCKACVTACHSLNGLDDHETWRDVGLLVGGGPSNPLMQHVTTACHHCLEPACMIGCPVDAYEKDPITGIVRHLDDQCFGCEYCTLTCPYDVPKYHEAKGIVRKCDMCSQRLAANEAPACVQACPHEAIAIGVVDVDEVRERTSGNGFLPAVPDSTISRPTTIYRTNRELPPNTLPADYSTPRPQHAHLPLVVMLVLTQLAAGAFLVGMLLDAFVGTVGTTFGRWHVTLSTLVLMAALGASTLHLGRPLYAFRGMFGWRHSWLSREILVFGAFAGVAVPFAASHWLPVIGPELHRLLGWTVVAVGTVGVYCSVMIYAFTRRELWTFARSGTRFGLTSLLLGLVGTWSVAVVGGLSTTTVGTLGVASVVVALGKLAYDASLLRHLHDRSNVALHRTAILMVGPLRPVTITRFAAGTLGAIVGPLVILTAYEPAGTIAFRALTIVALLLAIVGELAERLLFFAAASPPRMPGGLRP